MNKVMKNTSIYNEKICISIDTLGGENDELTVIRGLELVRGTFPHVSYILHGNSKNLQSLLNDYPELKKISQIKNARPHN